jgi:serine/threonine-protein kinase
MNVGAWWSVTTILATLASRVIYGLRREVKTARRLGQYTLEEKIGEGGMGAVYRARHAMLRRPTAVKLLLPHKTGAETLARFEREVQLTARLAHPNTVTIFDYGRTSDGVFYYAMELLDGLDLESLVLATGAQPPARVLHVLDQVAGALHEAHGVGLIHRDIKPANIMLCRRGGVEDVAKVVDFGLVKQLHERPDVALTQGQTITGTPLYMSPEMITAPDKIDGRSDLYALGAVGYFMLTAQQVFEGGSLVEVCSKHLNEKPIPPSERGSRPLPSDLEALVLACLEKDPASRPQTAAELQARVRACADFGRWGDKQAAEWRARHNAQLVACKASCKMKEQTGVTCKTVEVDMHQRNIGSA